MTTTDTATIIARLKAKDVEIVARALFELQKLAEIEELEGVDWENLPDGPHDGHPMMVKSYYRVEVAPYVEALWRAGRLR